MSTPQLTSSQPDRARRAHWTNHLERHAFATPDQPAIRFRGTTTTWAQLHARVAALADALWRRGVRAGDRVALIMGNRPEFLESVLAANLIGAIAVPLNFRLTGPEAAYILDDAGAAVVIVDEIGSPVASALPGGEGRKLISTVRVDGAEDYDTLLSEAGDPHPATDVPESSPALIMYTSGTTGRPKGAVLSHSNLQAQAVTVLRAFAMSDEGEINLVASPLFHIGAIGSVVPTIFVGGTLVIMPTQGFTSTEVLDLVESERVSTVFLVPTQWQAICDDDSVSERDLGALRVTAWGAAPATDTLLRRMAEVFPSALNVALFGQTEMSPVTCVLRGEDALRKLGSVGRPIPSVAVRVVDPDMQDVVPGEVGEIVYRGSGLMLGYWNQPDATAEAFRGGWFHSGDLVRVDEDGYVYVVDRAKDMIISGGENIYCAEVENVLAAHPDFAEVTVIGRPHEQWGETPVAVVVLRDDSPPPDLQQVRTWASRYLARYKLPTGLEIASALPRNASGKVLKNVLRERSDA